MSRPLFFFDLSLLSEQERIDHYLDISKQLSDSLSKGILLKNHIIKKENIFYKYFFGDNTRVVSALFTFNDPKVLSSIHGDEKLTFFSYCLNEYGDFYFQKGFIYQKTLIISLEKNVQFPAWDIKKSYLKAKINYL